MTRKLEDVLYRQQMVVMRQNRLLIYLLVGLVGQISGVEELQELELGTQHKMVAQTAARVNGRRRVGVGVCRGKVKVER